MEGKRKRRLSMRHKDMIVGYMFVLPLVIGLALFFVPMLVQVVRYSVSDMHTVFGERYVLESRGIYHYRHAFTVHPTFTRVLTTTMTDLLWNVPLIIFFSLFMAILLNREFTGRVFVRALFFLPVVLAIPAIQNNMNVMNEMITGGMDAGNQDVAEQFGGFHVGFMAMMLYDFGIPPRFIDTIITAMARLHIVLRSAGVQMIIFLAALQSIPKQLYEVAQVEGATAYETFWKVTMPMISPLILTNVVYTIVDNFVGSPLIPLANNLAFGSGVSNFGLSATFSLISTAAVSLLILISGFAISRKVFYQT